MIADDVPAVIWNAEEYKNHSSIQYKAANDLLKKHHFNGSETVIDIGCGDGKITYEISKRLPKGSVDGIDISPEMISFASSKFPKGEHPNLRFYEKSANDIDVKEKKDVIFSSFALQWVKDIDDFLAKANTTLLSEGKFIATVPLSISVPLEVVIEETIHSPKWNDYFKDFKKTWHFRKPEVWKSLLESHGFKILELNQVEQVTLFDSRNELEQYIIQWFPYFESLPKEMHKEFFKEVMDKYFLREPLGPTGKARFVFDRVDFACKKANP